ncbi:MAG: SPOR domain-containing protein, partial [Candidatus Adiutrix sp.]
MNSQYYFLGFTKTQKLKYFNFGVLLLILLASFVISPPAQAETLIQAMSLRDHAAAEKETSRLYELGIPAFSRQEQTPDQGLWHVVYIGPFETAPDARAAAAQLKTQGLIGDFVVRTYQPQTSSQLANQAENQSENTTGRGNGAIPTLSPAPQTESGALGASPQPMVLAPIPT